VTTQNNVAAEMTQGIQIPIQTVANNTVTVSFKDAALTLKVTPQITAANTVIMQIAIENASADFSRAVGGIPPINTQREHPGARQRRADDGHRRHLREQEQSATDKTPVLSRIRSSAGCSSATR
jgi:Flp pilus assembly secretin CpaC